MTKTKVVKPQTKTTKTGTKKTMKSGMGYMKKGAVSDDMVNHMKKAMYGR